MIQLAMEADVPRILEIEQEAISPPWMESTLLNEIYNKDSFFALAAERRLFPSARVAPVGVGVPDDPFRWRLNRPCRGGNLPPAVEPAKDTGINIAGFIILRQIADESELLQIAVGKAYRRRGTAGCLMSAAFGWAHGRGIKSIFLEVRESNAAAIALYAKHGFTNIGIRKNYFTEPIENAVLMRRM